ncbi:MAG TPA: 1-deoxy-D-xylulose-5-phosphate synthase [Verrucomicrobiae bacterium]|nr:1-deoxy-D-xylulose-5-phosphate synthase [Verrucomicrobiae bacterium]
MVQGTGTGAAPGGAEPILGRVTGPADCRRLTRSECQELAQEIRDVLIETVTRTGGHLGPNLGIVELTLALHRVFDSPVDALIFDTGHQAYVHKLITGRRPRFESLRQRDGLSGYPSRSESDHDWVENSHASTALSYALGLAQMRRRSGVPGRVVAVVGDGSLTGGMAYEALNNIGSLRPDLTIVLNDNGRSYAPTVGGLANHLARLRLDPHYQAAKSGIGDFLSAIPGVGDPAHEVARRLKTGVKQLVAPQVFFEDLGLKYAGPIDGHDLAQVERALRLARRLSGPVVVHVVTEKGRGYPPALADEIDRMHGVSALPAAVAVAPPPTYTDVFGECLLAAAAQDPSLVAITAAMGSSTGLLEFARRYPDRFYDVGIAEQHAVTFAAGLAMGGAHPVVCIYSTFLQRAFDQVAMDVALHNLPVTFVLDRAGVGGEDGSSAHGAFDLSYLRCLPNLVVATPRDAVELGRLLATGLRHPGPFALRYPKGRAAEMAVDLEPVAIGSWEVIRPGGRDVLFAAAGKMVAVAEAAATQLAESGVRATVLNARFVKPLDERLGDWAGAHRAVVSVEDGTVCGGLGSAVSEALAAAGVVVPVRHCGLPDRFLPHGTQSQLLVEAGLTAAKVVAAARSALASADRLDARARELTPLGADRSRAAG